jgi:hypothetical protein
LEVIVRRIIVFVAVVVIIIKSFLAVAGTHAQGSKVGTGNWCDMDGRTRSRTVVHMLLFTCGWAGRIGKVCPVETKLWLRAPRLHEGKSSRGGGNTWLVLKEEKIL